MNKATQPQPNPPQPHEAAKPKLPHERDESSNGQSGPRDERVKQAARDLEAGLKDTGRGPAVEKLKREHFPTKPSGSRAKP
jgi:hypothetical protein